MSESLGELLQFDGRPARARAAKVHPTVVWINREAGARISHRRVGRLHEFRLSAPITVAEARSVAEAAEVLEELKAEVPGLWEIEDDGPVSYSLEDVVRWPEEYRLCPGGCGLVIHVDDQSCGLELGPLEAGKCPKGIR